MSYSEDNTETFYYFSDAEKKLIEQWIIEHGYTVDTNHVCGSCCGMYADYYYPAGIGGNFKKEDQKKFAAFAKENNIACSIDGYTITADPNEGEDYQIKTS